MARSFLKAFFLLAALSAGQAFAQSCHTPVHLDSTTQGWTLALGVQAATFNTTRFTGNYEGTFLNAVYDARFLRAQLFFPQYRIIRNGLESYGLGDTSLGVQVPLGFPPESAWAAGVGLYSSLPTGDAHKDLGMGHVMLMPELWLRWHGSKAQLQSSLTYGAALITGEHVHSGAPGPVVSPMNTSELELRLSGGYAFHPSVRARVGGYGATPLGTFGGAPRAAAFAGVNLSVGRWDLGVDAYVPVVGNPFQFKALMTASVKL